MGDGTSGNAVQAEKAALRRRIRAMRESLAPDAVSDASRAIAERLLDLPELQPDALRDRFVSLYHPMRGEVDPTWIAGEIARRGARVVLPVLLPTPEGVLSLAMGEIPLDILLRCDGPDEPGPCPALTEWLDPGAFGLLEPSHGSLVSIGQLRHDLACVVIPGLAFGPLGQRLGWGKGYYDDFLRRLGVRIPVVAPAHDFQVLPAGWTPAPWDVPVDVVVTPSGVRRVPMLPATQPGD